MKMAAIPLSLTLTLHNSVSSCMSLASLEQLSFNHISGCVPGVRESVHSLFKRTPGFPTDTYLTPMDRQNPH